VDICMLGLGQMGSTIAERLIDAGHTVRVWNRSPGKADALVSRGAVELDDAKEGGASRRSASRCWQTPTHLPRSPWPHRVGWHLMPVREARL